MSHLALKVVVAALVGLGAAAVALVFGVPELSPLVGWVVASSVFLTWAWSRAWPADSERTRSLARHEDRSRKLVDALIIAATLLSTVLVVLALLRSQQKDVVGLAAAILAVVGVVAAWALINTVYAFKYARMYYLDDGHRFDFDQDEDPAYSDFAYTAFSIGMAYNASNVTQSSTPSRRIAMGHALLSYFFGTFVVAVAINLITGLTQEGEKPRPRLPGVTGRTVIRVSQSSIPPEHAVPGDRQRLTVAHELGHLVLHARQSQPVSAADATRRENEAHRFASAFLAPGDAVINDLGGARVSLIALARLKKK